METLFLVKTFVLLFVAKYPFRSWQLLEPPYFMCIFSVVKIWKPKDLSVDEWIRKIYIYIYTHTHTHSGIYIAIKKEMLSFMTTWMEFESIMLKETKQRKTNTA